MIRMVMMIFRYPRHHHHHLPDHDDDDQVRVGDEIHVSSHINAVPYLALAMEQVGYISDIIDIYDMI